MTRASYNTSSNLLREQLNWNNLSVNRQKQKAVLMFKTLKGQTSQFV